MTLVFQSCAAQEQLKLTQSNAEHLAKLPLKCIQQEYPNKTGQVLNSIEDAQGVKEFRPAFYGCFDWHSSVHGHWMLIKLLKTYPNLHNADSIYTAISNNMTPQNIAKEVAFFETENNSSFERMYGWAWLLKLAEELHTWDSPKARVLEKNLQPLTDKIVKSYLDFLPKLNYPIRVGTHTNSAFGMSFALDYARTVKNKALEQLIIERSKTFYLNDQDCPASWEPDGYDFFSPCLMEAELMAKILEGNEFVDWINAFLPGINEGNLKIMTEVGVVSDRSDGHLVHLDGLNFSRAWCFKHLSQIHGMNKNVLLQAADRHLQAALPNIADGDYMGEHWLASFAIYALSMD